MLTNRKITTYADNIKDMSDTPSSDGITAPYLKAKFDGRTDKEIKDAINGIVDDLTSTTDGSSGADNISATPVYENGSSTSQGILEELKAKKIETANIISTITTAMREDKVPNEKAIYLIMEAIGAGDMVKSVYDPTNQAKDIFNELSILNEALNAITTDKTELTLVNGWLAWADNYKLIAVKNGNIITMVGVISGGTIAQNTIITTLPSGLRPSSRTYGLVQGTSTNYGVLIDNDGTVKVDNSFGSTWDVSRKGFNLSFIV